MPPGFPFTVTPFTIPNKKKHVFFFNSTFLGEGFFLLTSVHHSIALRQRNGTKNKKLQSIRLSPLFFFFLCCKCEKGERKRYLSDLALKTCTGTCLFDVARRDSRFLGLFGCVYVRGTCGLPPTKKKTKTKHVGADRVARVFFVSQFAHADCGCADADTRCVLLCLVWCGVGLALATHARKLARMH